VRTSVLAVACAVLGGVAALGVARLAGLEGTTRTTTVVERAAAAPQTTAALPAAAGGFSPAQIYRERAAGVVTVFSSFGGTAAQGSGFVVDAAGTILTNAHVITNAGETAGTVSGASSVYVEFPDRDRVLAHIVGWDVFDDVGVLRVDPQAHPLDPLPLGRSASVVVGQPVAAIGSPLGNVDSLAVGVVSAIHRSIAALTADFALNDAIQTDAPIAHGSSGGPLLDAAGRVIGLNAQIRTDQGAATGIGFAVPIDAARRSLRQLLTKGNVSYAFAGIQAEDLTPSLAAHLKLSVDRGALVDHVTAGGPADRAGIRGGTREVTFLGESHLAGGDVVVALAGRPVANADALVRIVTNELEPRRTVTIAVFRQGARRTFKITLAARPAR
jgi:S1-C subfamily serine protease